MPAGALIADAIVGMSLAKSNMAGAFAGEMEKVKAAGEETTGGFGNIAGKAMGIAASGIAIIGGAAITAGVAAIGFAKSFDSQMTLVQTQAGYSAKEVDGLRGKVLDLAKDTGTAPDDLAKGLYHIASAGIPASQAMEVLRAAAIGAKVGQADMETVTNALTGALNSYGLSGKDAGEVMGTLNKIVGDGNMRMQDLAGGLGAVLPVAAKAGINLNEVGANIDVMTKKGLSAQMAMNSLQSIIMGLEVPGSKATKALKDIGMSADQLRQEIKDKGLAAAIGDLDKRTHGNIDTLHNLLPNVRALRDELGATGSSAADYSKTLADMNAKGGNTKGLMDAWSATQKDFNTQLDKAKTTVQVAAINFGEKLLPVLAKILPIVTDLAMKGFAVLTTALDRAPGTIQTVANVFGQIYAKVSPLFPILAKMGPVVLALAGAFAIFKTAQMAIAIWTGVLVPVFGALSTAFGILTSLTLIQASASLALDAAIAFLTSPIVLVSVAIAALLAIGYLLVTHWNQIKELASKVGGAIKDGLTTAFHAVIGVAHTVLDWFSANWPMLLEIILAPFTGGLSILIPFLASHWSQIIGAIGGFVSGVARWFVSMGGIIWDGLTGIVANVAKFGLNLIVAIGREMMKLPGQMLYAFGYAIGTVVKWGVDLFNWATTTIPQWIGAIMRFLIALPGQMMDNFVRGTETVIHWGEDILAAGIHAAETAINAILSYFHDLPGHVMDQLVLVVSTMVRWGGQLLTAGTHAAESVFNAILGFFISLPGHFWDAVIGAVDKMAEWGGKMVSAATDAAKSIVKAIIDELSKLPGMALDIGKNVVGGIAKGIVSAPGKAIGAAGDLLGNVVHGAQDAIQAHSPSRVFADLVGAPIAQGIAVGITENMGGAKAVLAGHMRELAQTTADASTGISANIAKGNPAEGAISMAQVEALLATAVDHLAAIRAAETADGLTPSSVTAAVA